MLGKFSLFKSRAIAASADQTLESKLKYCPECKDEYRQEFSQCAVCKIELINRDTAAASLLQHENRRRSRSLEISTDDELVSVKRGNLLEMKNLQRLLKQELIGSLLVEECSDGNAGCCNSKIFDLKVKEDDTNEAHQILVDEYKRTTALDSHEFHGEAATVFDQRAAEATCPACGAHFQTDSRVCPECGLCF